MSTIPQDLQDYLLTMISPPDMPALFWDGLEGRDLTTIPDNTISGLLLRGQPTVAQSKDLNRILKPGAMLLLIAPESEPTGHTGACRIEDAGFEIRDAICWADKADDDKRFHYIPKPSRSEREAGCHSLPSKTGAEAVERKEGTAGLDNPRAGAGRTASTVHNVHPTVKPIDLMERLLQSIPTDQGPVIDPFCGSGSTAIACIRTGHDFIGIDREEEYLAIQGARTKHWKDKTLKGDNWDNLTIETEYVPDETVVAKPVETSEDIFGW